MKSKVTMIFLVFYFFKKSRLRTWEVSVRLNLMFLGNFDPFIINEKNVAIFLKIGFFLVKILV